MVSFYLHASRDHKTCEARGLLPTGEQYNINAEYTTTGMDDGKVEYKLTWTYGNAARVFPLFPEYWVGALADDGDTLAGKSLALFKRRHTFALKRVSPEILVDRPHPREFTQDKVKALWKYALTAVQNQVRRELFSWSYLKERRDLREEYLELLRLPKRANGRSTRWKLGRFSPLNQRSTVDDVWHFHVIQEYGQSAKPEHL